ncbi:MAG: SMC family ATPase [Candidatus Eisenbacteria bacterium]
MRPLRLHLEGFASFREPCDIDFSDAELFVITGPTGAGKSSLIDAMTFALYGSVPRLDARTVFPVITTGKSEARVAFDFSVGDEEYTAARVVRRTKTGASTKEARLERKRGGGAESTDPAVADTETIAGDADSVTAAVESLLGLGFAHFQKCVALPQGEFAEFLRATPAERQDLLVKLLDLDLYRRMAKRANALGKEHETRADYLEAELAGGELAQMTPELLAAAKKRGKELEALARTIEKTAPKLDELRRKAEEARAAQEIAETRVRSLATVHPPKDLDSVSDRWTAAREASDAARSAKKEAEAHLYKEQAALEALPAAGDLQVLIDAHAQKAAAALKVKELEAQLGPLREAAAKDEAARAKAEAGLTTAETKLDEARTAHAAAHLAEGLAAGDECPVCAQTITKMPKHAAPKALEAAARQVETAKAALLAATKARDASTKEVVGLSAKVEGEAERLAALEERLANQPTEAALKKALAKTTAAAESVGKAQTLFRTASKDLEVAEAALEKLEASLKNAWKTFDTTRDRVSLLEPPPVPDRDDLAGAWTTLTTWAEAQVPKETKRVDNLAKAAKEQEDALAAETASILASCSEHGVKVTATNYATQVASDLATVNAGIQAVSAAIEKSKKLRAEQKELREQAKLEKSLGRLLGTTGFEAWLLQRALERLCQSASHLLRELSSNQYSIQINDKREFEVVDHSNADEPRLARTLSGGETFMASLALALALSEDVAQLAAGGVARLDTLFLDEGFGTLDPDTLDTVASAIEALGARGRVVGLITHVRELAERVPVRFQVTKDAKTSRVERVTS